MSIAEIRELFRIALTWVDGDVARANAMVNAFLAGHNGGLRP